jgi:hypothetical protein
LQACNFSAFNLNSITMSGSNYVISAQLCIGAGRTGVTLGADGATFDVLVGIYRAAGPVNIVSFTPTSLLSSFTGCNMDGYDIGPEPTTFFTQATLYYYFDPLAYPLCANGFTCINSTALCGNVHSDCFNLTLTLDALPDSMRFFGVEGSGNPFAGCTPNPDMLIDLSTLSVDWAGQSIQHLPGRGVQVDWSCWTPDEGGQFGLQRKASQDTSWQAVAALPAPRSTASPFHGTYLDAQPLPGASQYRIVHFLPNGVSQASEAMEIYVDGTRPVLSPNPTSDDVFLQTGLMEPAIGSIEIVGTDGKRYILIEGELKPYMNLELYQLPEGVYHVGVRLPGQAVTWLKLLKQ